MLRVLIFLLNSLFHIKHVNLLMCYQQQNNLYPQRWQVLGKEFMRYLDLCYVTPSSYYRLRSNQKLQEIVFEKSAPLRVKGILLQIVHLGEYAIEFQFQ